MQVVRIADEVIFCSLQHFSFYRLFAFYVPILYSIVIHKFGNDVIDVNSIERANKRKVKAIRILDELQLIQKWSTVGNCFLVGATAYDLIVSHDIDIETFSEEINPDKIMKELVSLINNKNVLELKYKNYIESDFKGFYFKIIYLDNEEEWYIDMWLFSNDRQGALSRDLVPLMKKALSESTRKAILEIKEALLEDNLNYSSIFIYQAVLDYGVSNVTDFLAWSKNHNMNQLIQWKPQ
ncbi:hypothetical protein ACIQXW_08635 [Lysinibacillus sp. NPDC097162]|uniref:hypothetical protein n=1 Tax=Lysinibacillus sp. NPDC097162 TaxID=3364140 RepID=UPI0037F98431